MLFNCVSCKYNLCNDEYSIHSRNSVGYNIPKNYIFFCIKKYIRPFKRIVFQSSTTIVCWQKCQGTVTVAKPFRAHSNWPTCLSVEHPGRVLRLHQRKDEGTAGRARVCWGWGCGQVHASHKHVHGKVSLSIETYRSTNYLPVIYSEAQLITTASCETQMGIEKRGAAETIPVKLDYWIGCNRLKQVFFPTTFG